MFEYPVYEIQIFYTNKWNPGGKCIDVAKFFDDVDGWLLSCRSIGDIE
jgi:hypothetical protein